MNATRTSSSEMTHRERVMAALRGEEVDRTPIALWRHFPGDDATAEGLVAATVRYTRALDLDFIKLMPTGMYPVIDYGVEVQPSTDDVGTTRFRSGPISESGAWSRLPDVSPTQGSLGAQVEAVRLLRAEIGPDTPIVQTIFSPLTMANKVIGTTDALQQTINEHPDILNGALEKLADDVIAFGRACLEAGADGFFFATQLATKSDLEGDAYARFGVPFDLKVLNALRDGATTTFLHLHGMDPLFELADLYPVDGVNWHDRDTSPTLKEALPLTARCLVAGIARRGSINDGPPDAAAAEVRDAIRQTGGRRLIVAPGCVIPDAAPHENLVAARQAVDVTA